KYIFSEDHKIIGIQFLFSGLIFFLIGGLLAMMVRIQIAWPNNNIPILSSLFPASWGQHMDPAFYNMLFSMHASIMIFFVIIPFFLTSFSLLCGVFPACPAPRQSWALGRGILER